MLNFDANAGHTLLPSVIDYLKSNSYDFLNPSSIHRGGQKARARVEEARENIKLLTKAKDYRIVFTSGATEANNTALFQAGVAANLLTSNIEHPSVLEFCHNRAKSNLISYQELNSENFNFESVDLKSCAMFSLIWANNETGQIFKVEELAKKAKALNPDLLIHTDAVQVLGKYHVDLSNSNIDYLSISSHKIGGLAGVGALVLKESHAFNPYLLGGPQEVHHRAGTENVLGIISFGLAARFWLENSQHLQKQILEQKTEITNFIKNNLENINFWSSESGLCNTISLQIEGVRADDLVVALDLLGFNISSGAACASGKPEPSHVLLAMGIEESAAKESIRISLGMNLEQTEVKNFCVALRNTVEKFRSYEK